MADLAILIKSYFREEALFNCINSICQNIDREFYNLYVADDGVISPVKKLVYEGLRRDGHVVIEFSSEVGASKARNSLLSALSDEKYILRLDDDFEIIKETKISAMIEILEENSDIGVIADLERQIGTGKGFFNHEISQWQGNMIIAGQTLEKKMIPLHKFTYSESRNGYRYVICDLTRNMLLFKRKVFDYLKWEDRLCFDGEHEDMLLQIKGSPFKLAFTISSTHNHRDDLSNIGRVVYKETIDRKHNTQWKKVFYEKWGIKNIKLRRPLVFILKAALVRLRGMFNKI